MLHMIKAAVYLFSIQAVSVSVMARRSMFLLVTHVRCKLTRGPLGVERVNV